MLCFRHANTRWRTSINMSRFLEVVVLTMSTTPLLSVINRMQWFDRKWPNSSVARTRGSNSRSVISADVKGLCHFPATHLLPNTAAKPTTLDASEYSLMTYEDNNLLSKNMLLPLKEWRNNCHACKSARAS